MCPLFTNWKVSYKRTSPTTAVYNHNFCGQCLEVAQHNKILDISSKWPSQQGSGKIFMRGQNSEHHAPRLDLKLCPLWGPNTLREHSWRERGLMLSKYSQNCTQTMSVTVNIPQKIRNPINMLRFWNAYHMYISVCKLHLFSHIYYKCIHFKSVLPSLSLSYFQLSPEWGKHELSF